MVHIVISCWWWKWRLRRWRRSKNSILSFQNSEAQSWQSSQNSLSSLSIIFAHLFTRGKLIFIIEALQPDRQHSIPFVSRKTGFCNFAILPERQQNIVKPIIVDAKSQWLKSRHPRVEKLDNPKKLFVMYIKTYPSIGYFLPMVCHPRNWFPADGLKVRPDVRNEVPVFHWFPSPPLQNDSILLLSGLTQWGRNVNRFSIKVLFLPRAGPGKTNNQWIGLVRNLEMVRLEGC